MHSCNILEPPDMYLIGVHDTWKCLYSWSWIHYFSNVILILFNWKAFTSPISKYQRIPGAHTQERTTIIITIISSEVLTTQLLNIIGSAYTCTYFWQGETIFRNHWCLVSFFKTVVRSSWLALEPYKVGNPMSFSPWFSQALTCCNVTLP